MKVEESKKSKKYKALEPEKLRQFTGLENLSDWNFGYFQPLVSFYLTAVDIPVN